MKLNYRLLAITVAGSLAATAPVNAQVALAGFSSAGGSPGTSFGQSGKAVFPFPGTPNGVAVDSHNRIVVAGTSLSGQIVVARFQADGKSADAGFGKNGIVVTNIAGGAAGNAVAIAAQDHIVVAGQTGGNLDVVLFDASGNQQSPAFCSAILASDWGGHANALAIDSSGRIVAAGGSPQGNLTGSGVFMVARFTSNGCPDPSFHPGYAISAWDVSLTPINLFGPPYPRWEDGRAVAFDGNGGILVGGPVWSPEGYNPASMTVVRYTSDGYLDPSFHGYAALGAMSPEDMENAVNAMVVRGSKVWLAGTYWHRFTMAGFDIGSGWVDSQPMFTNFAGGSAFGAANALILTPDNYLVAGGSWGIVNPREFAMTEYDAGANLVQGFGSAGVEKLDVNCGSDNWISGLANQFVGRQAVGQLIFGYYRIIAAGPSGPSYCPPQ